MIQKLIKKYWSVVLLIFIEQLGKTLLDYANEKKVTNKLERNGVPFPDDNKLVTKKSLFKRIFQW